MMRNKKKRFSAAWERHLERMATEPDYREKYRKRRKNEKKKKKSRMKADPEYAEKVRQQVYAYKRRYLKKPENQQKRRDYNNRRYAENAEVRMQQARICKKWRNVNRAYDMGRKTIDSYGMTEEKREQRAIRHRRWLDGLNARQRAEHDRKVRERAIVWYRQQYNDPEIGWAFRLLHSRAKSITRKERQAARKFYDAKMAERKEGRRIERIRTLCRSSSREQEKKMLESLAKIDPNLCMNVQKANETGAKVTKRGNTNRNKVTRVVK